MTHKFKNVLMLLFGAMFFLVACQNDAVQEVVGNHTPTEIEGVKAAYLAKVSVDDAKRVAGLFNGSGGGSRALKVIKEIKVGEDENGTPTMYVVNFANNQGFVLVSATRNFLPVLAYNDEGNFTIPEENVNGLSLWMEKTKQNVKIANALPADSTAKFRSEWNKYEEQGGLDLADSRLANSELDQYAIQLTSQWQQNGVEWCSLEDAQAFLSASQYQAWSELVAGAIDPSFQDVNPLTYSFVVTEFTDYGSGYVDNFIHTNWNQWNGYNDRIVAEHNGMNYPAGCTTIAMAQIMRYHEYPTTESWYLMFNDFGTPVTADFIYDVAETIGVQYGLNGTGATIDQVKDALISYGYSTNIAKISHNIGLVRNELDNRRPVYMRGESSGGGMHAWVASGYSITLNQTYYKLYVPVQNASIGFPYINIENYLGGQTNSVYFYMNWGQGKSNGFYNDYNLGDDSTTANSLGITVDYNRNRQDLINITPSN